MSRKCGRMPSLEVVGGPAKMGHSPSNVLSQSKFGNLLVGMGWGIDAHQQTLEASPIKVHCLVPSARVRSPQSLPGLPSNPLLKA